MPTEVVVTYQRTYKLTCESEDGAREVAENLHKMPDVLEVAVKNSSGEWWEPTDSGEWLFSSPEAAARYEAAEKRS